MDELTPAGRAAQRLLDDKETLAQAITDALYTERPELLEKHGSAGRAKCLQDLRYTIEHLLPAVDLAKPTLFVEYVRWLDNLLQARNVSTGDVVRSLELTEQLVRERFPRDEAGVVVPIVRAGLDTLSAQA